MALLFETLVCLKYEFAFVTSNSPVYLNLFGVLNVIFLRETVPKKAFFFSSSTFSLFSFESDFYFLFSSWIPLTGVYTFAILNFLSEELRCWGFIFSFVRVGSPWGLNALRGIEGMIYRSLIGYWCLTWRICIERIVLEWIFNERFGLRCFALISTWVTPFSYII